MGVEVSPHTESCRVCGVELKYLEEARVATCMICGRTDNAHVVCPQGHYVCDRCHGADFLDDLGRGLDEARSASPYEIAEDLMALPNLPMLGCEHAHIAAGSLMRALENAGVQGVTGAHRVEALERTARQAVGAYCGLTGVCGVVPALGACYSVLVGGACGKGAETRGAMQVVSRLAAVTAAHADPGCCKAYVRAGLRETATFLEEHLGITMPPPPGTVCVDAARHPHGCRGSECDWHPDHPAESHSADETLHVAMTVGATRMQVMLRRQADDPVPTVTEPETEPDRRATLADSPTPDTPHVPLPTFKATAVVSQAAGG
ncbi:MAG: DUF5714 domain-containing protein [Thermoleophilia bacterium]